MVDSELVIKPAKRIPWIRFNFVLIVWMYWGFSGYSKVIPVAWIYECNTF